MKSTTTGVGVDLAKRVFQWHGVERETGEIKGLKRSRAKFLEPFAPRTPCGGAREACGGAPHGGRPLRERGHPVKLLSAKQVRPFVRGHTTEAQEARAIGTAAPPPALKEVAINSEAPQAVRALHRMRRPLMTCRHAPMSGRRGLLAADGDGMPQGYAGMRRGLAAALERGAPRLPQVVVETWRAPWTRVGRLPMDLTEIESRLQAWHRDEKASQRRAQSPGVGLLSATAAGAMRGDPKAFKSGREVAAWLGLVPRHRGTGGRVPMRGLSKQGERSRRTLLIHGARSVLTHRKTPPEWAVRLTKRRPFHVAVVALAYKRARTLWALLAHDREYQDGVVRASG